LDARVLGAARVSKATGTKRENAPEGVPGGYEQDARMTRLVFTADMLAQF
jgi:hypothetical protein